MEKICKRCKKNKKIHCKKMCHRCYSVEYRKTPSGNEAMKKYNNGKGIEARERYLLNHYKPKEPRVLNRDKSCECGSVVMAKGFCVNCYHRNRNGSKGINRINRNTGKVVKKRIIRPKKIDDDVFDRLCDLVISGIPLYKALEYEKMNRWYFYHASSDDQKSEIKSLKRPKSFIDPFLNYND